MKIEMRGYSTHSSQKNGETDDGKQEYTYSRNLHLAGSFEVDGKKKYISEHTSSFSLPYIVKEENPNRVSTRDPVYITMCIIISLKPILNQAGEPRREKGDDLFEAEIEV